MRPVGRQFDMPALESRGGQTFFLIGQI